MAGGQRAVGVPTVPSKLSEELDTNPFLRGQSAELRAAVGMADPGFSEADVFAAVRKRKDEF